MEPNSNTLVIYFLFSCGEQNLDLQLNLVRNFFLSSLGFLYLWSFNDSLFLL